MATQEFQEIIRGTEMIADAKEIEKVIPHRGDMRMVDEIRDYCQEQINGLWDEVKRFENPHKYYVDLSEKLWQIKHGLLMGKNKEISK